MNLKKILDSSEYGYSDTSFDSRVREWLQTQDDRTIQSICNRYTYTFTGDKEKNIELLIDEINYGNPSKDEKTRRFNLLKYRFSPERGY